MKRFLYAPAFTIGALLIFSSSALSVPNSTEPFRHYTGVLYTPISGPVSLPFLPEWTGYKSEFYTCKKSENPKRGTVGWDLEYHVMENAPQIFDWYSTALKQGGWKVAPIAKNGRSLAAYRERERTQCSIFVTAPQKRGFKSTLVIGYTIFKPKTMGSDEEETKEQNRPIWPLQRR